MAACYFTMVRHQKTGQYHADVKGYLRAFSGYCNGTRLEQLSEEISGLAALVKELEAAQLCVNEEELQQFSRELELGDMTEGRLVFGKQIQCGIVAVYILSVKRDLQEI